MLYSELAFATMVIGIVYGAYFMPVSAGIYVFLAMGVTNWSDWLLLTFSALLFSSFAKFIKPR